MDTLSQEIINIDAYETLTKDEVSFSLLPYMHSESKIIHNEAEKLFKALTHRASYEFELKHKVIIDQFGRYPHRNKILSRESTPEEIDFLKKPNSNF